MVITYHYCLRRQPGTTWSSLTLWVGPADVPLNSPLFRAVAQGVQPLDLFVGVHAELRRQRHVTKDNSHMYSWDAEGRPVTIDGVGLTYDALGRMVEQNRSGTYTQIVYAPSGSKLALMNGQSLQKGFVPLPGKARAVYTASGLGYYGHADWLGSIRLGSTPSRGMYFDVAYAPFGEAYAQSGSADLSFTGQNQDTVGGLYDFPAREYSTQGRWPSPGPGRARRCLTD